MRRKIFKKLLWTCVLLFLIPVVYVVISLVVTYIPASPKSHDCATDKRIYLSTNGVHLEIIIGLKNLNDKIREGLYYDETDQYLSFGWGDREFYLNTPTWNDVTFGTAFQAVFLKGESLMHIGRHNREDANWVAIDICEVQLEELSAYINSTFKSTGDSAKIRLHGKGYWDNDDFYEARGSFSCFKSCNTWANTGLKKIGLRTAVWTPFDFGVLRYFQ